MLRHISRFVVVGVINTVVYYSCYLLLNTFLPYLAAHLTALVIAMVGSFFLNTYWTFQTRPTWKKFAIFPLTNLTNYVVQTFGVVIFVETLHLNEQIAPLASAVVAIPITFLLSRKILLEKPAEERISAVMHEGDPA